MSKYKVLSKREHGVIKKTTTMNPFLLIILTQQITKGTDVCRNHVLNIEINE